MSKGTRQNPITKPLFLVSTSALVLVGTSAALDWRRVLDSVAVPLLTVCALLVLAYCMFALRLGEIGSISQTGRAFTHSRKKEPISFYFLWLLYTTLSLTTATYLIGRWVGYFG